ncbi:MAG: AsmA family protein [Alphaproteobacteria bacterium]|nr:AsmA family protein [Alphaproteobacteria bacterium]
MNKFVKILIGLVVLVVVIFAGAAIFVSTLAANKYRPQIIAAVEKATGRTVELKGPISFSLGLGGVRVSIQDASIGNPTWASRKDMAGMGEFTVGVGLLPLLNHSVSINELTIKNADILMETNAAGQHNWDFSNPANKQPAVEEKAAASSSGSTPSISVDKLAITDSKLAMRDATGKVSSYNVSSLTIGMQGGGAELKFTGSANGAPVTVDVKTGLQNLMGHAPFPFDADVTYDIYHLTAKGTADMGASKADISEYKVEAGKSTITGTMKASWATRPSVRGTLTSTHLDPADFKSKQAAAAETPAPAAPGKSAGAKRMFSDAPLPLDGLKSADAAFDVSIADLVMGKGDLKNITAKLDLDKGNLVIAPVKADIGGSTINMQVKLNAAASPAQLTVGIKGDGVDLGDLQKLGDMAPFMTGKASADIELSGSGDSQHAIASSLGGIITVTAEKGEILTGAAADVSSALATIFNPKGGNAALNCLAARFVAKGGVLTDNGILIDSVPTTVAGKGSVNLGAETVNLVLNAKTKLVDIGGLVPPLDIEGTLSDPSYSVGATQVVKNLVGQLTSGNIDVLSSSVPDIQTAPAGQNACVYTLDHPQKATQSTILPAGAAGKASQQIQNLGNSLVKGLFGK